MPYFIIKEVEKDDNDEEPPKKQGKKSKETSKNREKPKTTKQSKSVVSKSKTSTKMPKRGKGLIPNPDIDLLEYDPTFSKGSNVPLMTVKEGLRAAINDDRKELKRLIADVKNVYTVNWERSPHVKKGPFHYAVLQENIPLLKVLESEQDRKEVAASPPKTDLEKKNNGR